MTEPPRATLKVPSCYCQIAPIEREIVFRPDIVPLPHPEDPRYDERLAEREQENRYRMDCYERKRAAVEDDVRREEALRERMRSQCPAHAPWAAVARERNPG